MNGSSRSLLDLHPLALPQVTSWRGLCADDGMDVLIYCVLRDLATQASLYAQGHSPAEIDAMIRHLTDLGLAKEADALLDTDTLASSGPLVTQAPPGLSYHQWHTVGGISGSLAVDFVVLVGGKPAWKDLKLYRRAGEIAERCGLTWSGRWKHKMKETAHVQFDDKGRLTMPGVAAGKF